MTGTQGYTLFDTAVGTVWIAWGDDGVTGVQLPELAGEATRARMQRHHPQARDAAPPPEIRDTIDRIIAHLAGDPDDLRDVRLDMAAISEFNREVYAVARGIAPGQTMTYGEIAAKVGAPRASREVGQAMGRNPFPLIVPCHRVLAAGGRLGGFSAPGGVSTKLRLLDIEGAEPNGQPSLF
jgi:methylated-DNA-[protein]-cysteine S-methyltransferase